MSDLTYPEGLTEFSDKAESTNDAVSYIRFDIFERTDAKTYIPHRGINLYMPETLANPTNVSWDTQSMGAASNDQGLMDSNYNRFRQSYEQLKGSMAAKAFGGSEASAQDILADKEQKIVNPYMKMLFRGVNFRNFELVFRFTPHLEKESKVIHNICKEFRAAALPSGNVGDFKWGYPRELEITYKYQGKNHPWLNKFKRCVVTDAHINYTGAGHYVSMRNGFPAETELRLQLSEIELLTRESVESDDPNIGGF